MKKAVTSRIEGHFGNITDPRIERTKLHKLIDILVIAICGAICSCDSWEDVEEFGKTKQEWFETFLELPNGIPSHDTFNRVFARIDPIEFRTCFIDWVSVASELIGGQVIAMDGKVLRRSRDRGIGKGAIDMVSAWACANHLVLGQVKVDEKSNEITAIPQLLKALEISGCIITIDAMGCQTEIAKTIVEEQADYVLALKDNQGNLFEDTQKLFEDLESSQYQAYSYDYEKTVNKGHGRIEIRECWTISDPQILCHLRGFQNWEKLMTVSRIRSQRWIGDEKTCEDRFHIASIVGAKRVLAAARSHWVSKTTCIGHWIWLLTKITAEYAKTMAQRISPFCVTSP